MFEPYGEWWAVKTKPGPKGNWKGPSLVNIDGDQLAWDGGPSGFTIHNWDDIETLKHYENDYAEDSNEWWDRIEEIRVQFEKDFPPENEIKVSAGWLAPDGKFYWCHYMDPEFVVDFFRSADCIESNLSDVFELFFRDDCHDVD